MGDREGDALAGTLVREVFGVQDSVSRTVLLGERLRALDDDTALEVIRILCRRAEKRVPVYQEILLSLVDIPTLARTMGYGKMSAVYLLAQERGYDAVVRILSRPPSRRRRKLDDEELPFDPEMEYVPLGVRKSLARGQVKRFLDRLIFDQDPSVIANLLLNPRLTEKEVLRIASRRPCKPAVLKNVYGTRKWIVRYSVKKALVRNPYTPPEIALRLLEFMLAPDLRQICGDESLHPDVVSGAKKLLEERGVSHEQRG